MTLEYFELVEITDPALMEPSSLLKWEDAIRVPRYADALQQVREAEARIEQARRAGGEKMRQKAISISTNSSRLERFLNCNFEGVLVDIRTEKSSVNHAVQRIRSRMTKENLPWPQHESAYWPSDSTLYKTLRKLAGS